MLQAVPATLQTLLNFIHSLYVLVVCVCLYFNNYCELDCLFQKLRMYSPLLKSKKNSLELLVQKNGAESNDRVRDPQSILLICLHHFPTFVVYTIKLLKTI